MTVRALLLLGALGLALALTLALLWPARQPPVSAPVLALERVGELATLRVRHSDVVEFHERQTLGIPWTQWELRLGGTSVLLVAKGDCTLGTDLKAARVGAVDAAARTLTLHLPPPRTLSARVSHAPRERGGSYFYAVSEHGTQLLLPGSARRIEAMNQALGRAQAQIERACAAPELRAEAQRQTEQVLGPLYQALGWSVRYVWA